MSNVNYSIVRGENDGAFRSGSFLRYAADGQGLMFAVFRLPNTPPSLSMAKQLQTAVERWSTKPSPEPHLLESAFESVIQELNEAALPSKTEKPNMQIIIGATSLDTLVITAVGHTRGAIIRPGGNNTFHVFDLLKALTEGHADEKIFFGELISGVFSKGDRLGLITADDSAIDAKSWKQMLATQPLGEIRLLLEQKFKTASGGAALALEVLDHARANEGKDSPISSIETLRKTEQTTEQLLDGGGFGFSTLGKSLFAYMKQFIHFSKKLFFRIRDFIQKKQSLEKPPVPSPEKTASSSRITVESLKTQVVKAARKTSSTIRNPLRITRGVRTLALQGVPNRLNALPKRARLIFFLLLCFGILFIQSIFLLRIQQSRADGQKAYAAEVTRIRAAISEAEAMIIYQDDSAARTTAQNALNAVNRLPQKGRRDRAAAEELRASLTQLLQSLRRAVTVSAETIATLPLPAPQDAFDRDLYSYSSPTDTASIVSVTSNGDRTLALLSDHSIVRKASDGTTSPVSFTANAAAFSDIDLFGERLYLLSPENSQLYKLTRSGETYSNSTAWVREPPASMKEARSMAIDGAIYVVTPTTVLKFFNGYGQPWNIAADPPISDALKIVTSDTLQGVYILEASQRRILVFSKKGSFLIQYLIPDAIDIKDFRVNEASKELSFLDGTAIRRFRLTHLEAGRP